MSGCLNLSPYKMSNNEEHEQHISQNSSLEKKGIVSILCSDISNPKISSSLNNNINININNKIKRSMSADMSSQKWQQNNEFPLKRLQSSDHLQSLVEEEENDNKKKVGPGGAAFEDIWSSILTNKKMDGAGSGPDPAPYVHPLMKRASSLNEKSLEICTESLGSETGSDGFSSPLLDHGEEHHEVVDEEYVVEDEIVRNNDSVEVGKFGYNNYPVKNIRKGNYNSNGNGNNGMVRSFPPPLLSLAHCDDGSNVEMRTRRQDGRLVVEAVSVPSRNCFRARREDGRLLLTLTNETEDDEEEEFDEDDEVVEEDAGNDVRVSDGVVAKVANALTFVMEESEAASRLPKNRVINVHTASPMMIMTKLMELTSTRNMSSWPRTSNRTVITSLDEGDEDVLGKQVEVESKPSQKKVTALLPPRPARVSTAKTAADVLNVYEYYWRRSDSPAAAAVALLTPLAGKQSNAKGVVVSPQVVKDTNKFLLDHNVKGVPKGEVLLVKAETVGGEYLVPMLRGCKEPRKSLFFLEPFCIATS